MKWLTPILPYLAVWVGLFWLHHAWLALLGFHLTILFSLLLVRSQIPVRILVKSNDIRWVILSILVCGSSGAVLYIFWHYFGFVSDLSAQVISYGLTRSSWPLFILYFTLANPLVEEYFWRGYLGSLTNGFYPSDFLYAGFHGLILMNKMRLEAILFCLIVLILAGWFWRQIAREDRGLLASVLGHMAADFTILTAVYFMSR